MGSYGIGVSRIAAAVIEASHDENGIIWPKEIAPFDIGLISMKPGDGAVAAAVNKIEADLEAAGLSVLTDDRDAGPGAKFADMDLIGLPTQIVVGPRGLARARWRSKTVPRAKNKR